MQIFSTLSHKSFEFFSVVINCQVVLSNDEVHFFQCLKKLWILSLKLNHLISCGNSSYSSVLSCTGYWAFFQETVMKLSVTLISTGSFLTLIFSMFPFDPPEKPLVSLMISWGSQGNIWKIRVKVPLTGFHQSFP